MLMDSDSKRMEIKISISQPAIIDKTLTALNKWKARRHSHKRPKSTLLGVPPEFRQSDFAPPPKPSRLPMELYDQILSSLGYDIRLLPTQLDGLKLPGHFRSYFLFVNSEVRSRSQTLRNCRLVSSAWNEIASKYLNAYLVIRENWKDHVIWKNEVYRRQVRHVWIIPYSTQVDDIFPNPWNGLFAMIFTGFPNLETLYASFPGCYDSFYSQHFLRLHVPPNLRILGLDGPILRGPANPIRGDLQLNVLRLFPRMETLVEVGSSSDDILIMNGFVHDITCSTIKMNFSSPLSVTYFSRLHSLSLTGGHMVQDDRIVSLASLCPPVRLLRICGFDRSFTMRGSGCISIIS